MKRKKRNSALKSRDRHFDAFVSFNFDGENDFVMDRVLPELEENPRTPLKLCLHSRDFVPGIKITENMRRAVQSSNSAIIVMSQNFVNSPLCREEFELCVSESEADAAFQMLVIMTQAHRTLTGTTDSMDRMFQQETYLQVEDPDLFSKIIQRLGHVRKEPGWWDCGFCKRTKQRQQEVYDSHNSKNHGKADRTTSV